ncbi:Glycine--tRNA ligase [compost metagenome]
MSSIAAMEQIVELAKHCGFIFPGSEIYGGLANTWDYGPLGVELKNNIKRAWWKKFIQESPYNVTRCRLTNCTSSHVTPFLYSLCLCKKRIRPRVNSRSSGLSVLQSLDHGSRVNAIIGGQYPAS